MKLEKIQKYYLYFMMYAVIGWIYEVVLETFIYKWGFTNRGVLFGPYCPVYGVGALLFIFCVYPLIKNKSLSKKIIMIPVVFISCMFLATVVELVTSYVCEMIMGSWPWQTYVDYKINFQGRIALSPSLRFGLGGILFLYILQPLFEKIVQKIGMKKMNILFWIILIIVGADVIYTLLK